MAKLLFPVQLQRQYGAPLDIDAVFATLNDMNNYLTSGRRYAGQLVTNLEQPGLIYILNNEMDGWIEFSPEQEPVLIETISDVTLTDLQTGQFLKYNGTVWINSDGVESINGFSGIVSLDTDDIPEGATNKYYPSADASKLAGIEAGAQVNTVDSVNGQTGAVELISSDIPFDNTHTDLLATNVHAALDELDLKKANVSALSSNIILYATTAPSDVVNYQKLVISPTDPDYNTTFENVSTGTITGTAQQVGALISEPGIIVGNPGIVNITTIGKIAKTAGNSNTYAEFYFEVLRRDDLGNEQLLSTSDTTGAVNPEILNSFEEFNASALLNNGIFLDTDRIVIKYYANDLAGGASEYQFQFGGNAPVRTLLPVPLFVTAVNQTALTVPVDTSPFVNLLSGADDNVQTALQTLDALTAGDLNALDGNDPRVENWDTAYSWGDHAQAGYLTSSSSLSAANITGTISSANLPALALTDVTVVNSEAAMIALTAQEGDVAIRTDINKSFIHTGNNAGDITDWTELLTPTDAVLSVNGYTGAVNLGPNDVGALDALDPRINDWDTAYAWGDHSQAGYLTSYTVTELDVTQHQAALSLTKSQISDFSVDISDINTTGTPSATTFLAGSGEWVSITGAVESVNGQTGIVELTNADLPLEEVEVSVNRVLELSDSGKLLRFVNAEPAIVYIPDESVVNFPLGSEIVVLLYSASSVSFEAVANAAINFIGESPQITQQFTSALLRKIASDEWLLVLPPSSGIVEETDPVFAASEAAKIVVNNAQANQVLSYNGEQWVNSDISVTTSQISDIDNILTIPGQITQFEETYEITQESWSFDGTDYIVTVSNLPFDFNERPYQLTLEFGSVPNSIELRIVENTQVQIVSLGSIPPQEFVFVRLTMDGRNSNLQQSEVDLYMAEQFGMINYDANIGAWTYEIAGTYPNGLYLNPELQAPVALNTNIWYGQGFATNQVDLDTVEINYSSTGTEWWNSNAILYLSNFDTSRTSLTTTFTGVAGHSYVFKLEMPGGSPAAEVLIEADGTEQTATIDFSSFTTEEKAFDKLVFFVVTQGDGGMATVTVDPTILAPLSPELFPYSYDYQLINDNGAGQSQILLAIYEPEESRPEGSYKFYPVFGFYDEAPSDYRAVISINGERGDIILDTHLWNEAYSWGNHADQGYLRPDNLPGLAITTTYVVADLTERDALQVEEGDVAIVTGESTTYIYSETSGWQQILAPGTAAVSSVNGQIGNVVLNASDVGAYDTAEIDTMMAGKLDITTFNAYVPSAITEQNASATTQIWVGTQAQYDAIGVKDANTLYFIEEV